MPRVLGLDVSANRIAWALADGGGAAKVGIAKPKVVRLPELVKLAATNIRTLIHTSAKIDAICIEVNLRPAMMNKGRQSTKMVKAYMRSRWVEGALFNALGLEEPKLITKIKGGYHRVPAGDVFGLQASGGEDAKKRRRQRMTLLYKFTKAKISEDEIDALAVAHECVIALTTGVREELKK